MDRVYSSHAKKFYLIVDGKFEIDPDQSNTHGAFISFAFQLEELSVSDIVTMIIKKRIVPLGVHGDHYIKRVSMWPEE